MTNRLLGGGRRLGLRTLVALAALVAPLAACENVTDTLLEATDPDLINPRDVDSPEGALALRIGTLDRLTTITAGGESTWLFGGLLADEWSTSSTFVQNDETDQRAVQEDNGTVTGIFRSLNQTRTSANQAIAGYREHFPDRVAEIAEMYFVRGIAEMQIAENFCNGVPLSDASGEELILGEPMPVSEVFERAVASYDSALALVQGQTGAAAVRIQRAASVGKGRALLGLGQYAAAGAAVAGVPTSFSYDVTFAVSSGDNTIWAQGASARRYTVGDSLEGNARNILVGNAIPFFSAQDPRLPVRYTVSANGRDTTKSQDGFTFSRTTTLYGRSTSAAVVNGIDARLIEAEAALAAGDVPKMLQILNALRASPPQLGDVQPAAMPALTDPGTAEGRVDLLFREKAFWTFSRGQRLGDLRRLVRQYGRSADDVFPTGVHYKGGNYGTDLNFPVPQQEENNPNFTGCTDRNA